MMLGLAEATAWTLLILFVGIEIGRGLERESRKDRF